MGSRTAIQRLPNSKQGGYDLMEENDALKQRINELEERITYIEKKFNISKDLPEVLFPKTSKVVEAVPQTTNGDE
jgi:cell division septum initiation protein DivIVA